MTQSSPVTETAYRAPEVFLFYLDRHLCHIHTNRKVFEDWMEKASWQYPPDRCEIVRYVPDGHAQTPAAPERQLILSAWKIVGYDKSEKFCWVMRPEQLLAALSDTSTGRPKLDGPLSKD